MNQNTKNTETTQTTNTTNTTNDNDDDWHEKHRTAFREEVQGLLQSRFGTLECSTEDFELRNYCTVFGLVQRGCAKSCYPEARVESVLIEKGLELMMKGFTVFFVFGFKKKRCIWKLKREQYGLKYKVEPIPGGGKLPDIKSCCYIDMKYLEDIIECPKDNPPPGTSMSPPIAGSTQTSQ